MARGKGAPGQAAGLRWSGLRVAKTALRCSAPGLRCVTPAAHCVRCGRTDATGQITKRAVARSPEACASRRPTCALPPARARLCPRLRWHVDRTPLPGTACSDAIQSKRTLLQRLDHAADHVGAARPLAVDVTPRGGFGLLTAELERNRNACTYVPRARSTLRSRGT